MIMNAPKQPDFVDERFLAEHFGLSRRYWQLLRQRREGPPVYAVGSRRLYDPAEVEQWLRQHRVGGGGDANA